MTDDAAARPADNLTDTVAADYSDREAAVFGASEASCIYAPEDGQEYIRRAFEDGVAFAHTGKLPPVAPAPPLGLVGAIPAEDLRTAQERISKLEDALERVAQHHPKTPGLYWDYDLQLAESAADIAAYALAEQPAPPALVGLAEAVLAGGLRPGLEEAMRKALCWALDEINALSNQMCQFGYPQGMQMLGRQDQFSSYSAACGARRLALNGPSREGEG